MEAWQVDFEWLRIRHWVKDRFGKQQLPDMNALLFVIGMQELGQLRDFTKEEKQDLMHIAVCRLLSEKGVYEFKGIDDDGWPHWERTEYMSKLELKEEESLMKELVITYFQKEIFIHETT